MTGLWGLTDRLPASVRRRLKSLPGSVWLRNRSLGRPAGRSEPGPPPVVYLPTWLEWDVMRQRPQYLLEALAGEGYPVYFVDPRMSRVERRGKIMLVPDLTTVPASGVILYAHFAPSLELVDRFRDSLLWYDYLDDLSIFREADRGLPVRRTVSYYHEIMLRRADVVTCSNRLLVDRVSRPDTLLVENGVDLNRFRPEGEVASDLPRDRPVIGYHGAVATWFDLDLLTDLVALLPDYVFVVVGPIEAGLGDRLPAAPNLFWLGSRSSDEIDRYVRGFDVGIIPFVVDEMTEAVTPLKLFEYLASGTPVVSTRLPACVETPGVLIADDSASFAEMIVQTVDHGPSPFSLRVLAEGASWQRRILPVVDRLEMWHGSRL
jgi:glycosyltransferase involved in cell wall biosynthesis